MFTNVRNKKKTNQECVKIRLYKGHELKKKLDMNLTHIKSINTHTQDTPFFSIDTNYILHKELSNDSFNPNSAGLSNVA